MHVQVTHQIAGHLWVICGFQRLSETPDGMAKFRKTRQDMEIIEWIKNAAGYKTEAAIWRRALRCLKAELVRNGYEAESESKDGHEQAG